MVQQEKGGRERGKKGEGEGMHGATLVKIKRRFVFRNSRRRLNLLQQQTIYKNYAKKKNSILITV